MKSFEQIVDDAIAFSKQNRMLYKEHFGSIQETMHAAAFAREFCTVHLDMGRRTGKTTYIKQHAGPDDVTIVMTAETRRREFVSVWGEVFAAHEVADDRFWMSRRGKSLGSPSNIVYIDEPELVQRRCSLDRIYQTFATGAFDQTFVLLGH